MAPNHLRSAVVWAYCALGVGLAVAYFGASRSPDAQHVVYQSLGLLGIGGLAVGIRRHKPEGMAWPFVLTGLVLWVSGDGYWNAYRLVTGREAPFPSPADAFYLAAYVPLLVGIVIMVRGGRPRAADILDALIIGLAVSLIVWFAAIHPTTQAHQPSLASAVIADAYPTMDYLLLLALAQLLVSRRRSGALIWITAAFATVLATDVVYAWLRSSATFTAQSLVNSGYFAFYVLLGAAALCPSMRDLGSASSDPATTAPTSSGRLSLLRLALLAMALMACPAALVMQGTHSDLASILVIAAIGATVSVLVLVRLSILFVERDRIDARRQHAEAALRQMAYNDALTTLPNRTAILRSIDELIATPDVGQFAVLFVDLDRFKSINDRFGHAAGDSVLRDTAQRLSRVVRERDTVARHGGDEFVILLRELPDDSQAVLSSMMDRIQRAVADAHELHHPNSHQRTIATVEASIGVALYPTDGTTTDALIHHADKRMYAHKHPNHERVDAA